MRKIRYLAAAVLVSAVTAAAGTLDAPATGAATTRSTSTPIIAVHGIAGGTCPAVNSASLWASLRYALVASKWTGPLVPVSYFACDTNGVDITSYSSASRPTAPKVSMTRPSDGYTLDSSIEDIARDLAWMIYTDYTRLGQAVDIIAASFGGLIARTALTRVTQRDGSYPPQLLVTDAVTLSGPMHGVTTDIAAIACPSGTLCSQLLTNGKFIASLGGSVAPNGTNGTDWTLLGSACDIVPTSTTLALSPAHLITYTRPCYAHAAYLTDASPAPNAVVRYTDPGSAAQSSSTFQHSLRLAVTALTTASR